jgi:type IV secretory pathway VirB6-like protein
MTPLRNIVKNLLNCGDLQGGNDSDFGFWVYIQLAIGAEALLGLFIILMILLTVLMLTLIQPIVWHYVVAAITVFIIICVSVAIVKRISLW